MRSFFVKQVMMNKTTFHTSTKGLAAAPQALAALCFSHLPMCYPEPKMIGVFTDRVLHPHFKPKTKDTTVATGMGHRIDVKDKTTRELAGHINPSKHELSFGIRYRHIKIHAPPSQYAGDRVFGNPAEEKRRHMYHTLCPALSGHPEQVVRNMKWDMATVQGWFAAADVKKRGTYHRDGTSTPPLAPLRYRPPGLAAASPQTVGIPARPPALLVGATP